MQLVTVTKTEMVAVYPPFPLNCMESPTVPEMISGQAVGKYVLQMDAAYEDCAGLVAEIGEWINNDKKQREKDAK